MLFGIKPKRFKVQEKGRKIACDFRGDRIVMVEVSSVTKAENKSRQMSLKRLATATAWSALEGLLQVSGATVPQLDRPTVLGVED